MKHKPTLTRHCERSEAIQLKDSGLPCCLRPLAITMKSFASSRLCDSAFKPQSHKEHKESQRNKIKNFVILRDLRAFVVKKNEWGARV